MRERSFSYHSNRNDSPDNNSVKNWKLDKADWTSFELLCMQEISVEKFNNHSDSVQKFTETLLQIANKSIPKTLTKSIKIKKPWCTEECDQAIKAPKKSRKAIQ
jgi:hypothetical protein